MNLADFPSTDIYFQNDKGILYNSDTLKKLREIPYNSINCVITSPPYWALRDYGVKGQIGLESSFQQYLENLWSIFGEIRRILTNDGTVWVVMGDTYSGSGKGAGYNGDSKESWRFDKKPRINENIPKKSLYMIPERFAIGMIDRGWILRNKIIWHKPNAMPSSVKDRFTVDFEDIFFFTKNKKYYFKQQFEPLKSNGRGGFSNKQNSKYAQAGLVSMVNAKVNPNGKNKRTTWSITTKPFKGAHFAVFPPEIPEIAIDAGCPKGGIVLDPFIGSGTVGMVAKQMDRMWIGIELNSDYCKIAKKRIKGVR